MHVYRYMCIKTMWNGIPQKCVSTQCHNFIRLFCLSVFVWLNEYLKLVGFFFYLVAENNIVFHKIIWLLSIPSYITPLSLNKDFRSQNGPLVCEDTDLQSISHLDCSSIYYW